MRTKETKKLIVFFHLRYLLLKIMILKNLPWRRFQGFFFLMRVDCNFLLIKIELLFYHWKKFKIAIERIQWGGSGGGVKRRHDVANFEEFIVRDLMDGKKARIEEKSGWMFLFPASLRPLNGVKPKATSAKRLRGDISGLKLMRCQRPVVTQLFGYLFFF